MLRIYIDLLAFSIFFIFIGTGFYTQLPSIAYIPVGLAFVVFIANKKLIFDPFYYLEPKLLLAFFVVNIFFIIELIFSHMEFSSFLDKFIAISMFILSYAYSKLLLNKTDFGSYFVCKTICIVVIISLILLLVGQYAETMGYIEQDLYIDTSANKTFLTRPGGFLNVNVTAAIAIVLIFALDKISENIGRKYFYVGMPLAITVVFVAQSRAAMIVSIVYFFSMVGLKNKRDTLIRLLLLAIFIYVIAGYFSDELGDLITNLTERFDGDDSSDERKNMLIHSWHAFVDSPVFGKGDQFLVDHYGYSSHNQILEILTNYGLIGLLVMIPASIFLYAPCSAIFFGICIIPTFLFSHNFYDLASYQVALGLALAADRVSFYKPSA